MKIKTLKDIVSSIQKVSQSVKGISFVDRLHLGVIKNEVDLGVNLKYPTQLKVTIYDINNHTYIAVEISNSHECFELCWLGVTGIEDDQFLKVLLNIKSILKPYGQRE